MAPRQTDVSEFILECFKQVMDNLDEKEKSYVKENQAMFIRLFNKTVLMTLELRNIANL